MSVNTALGRSRCCDRYDRPHFRLKDVMKLRIRHVHKENSILFPRAAEAEAKLSA
jgi:iron-sulfur cluster repair protein YtfE (RIC family)